MLCSWVIVSYRLSLISLHSFLQFSCSFYQDFWRFESTFISFQKIYTPKITFLIKWGTFPDRRRLYTAPCGIRTKWPSGRCTPLYWKVLIIDELITKHSFVFAFVETLDLQSARTKSRRSCPDCSKLESVLYQLSAISWVKVPQPQNFVVNLSMNLAAKWILLYRAPFIFHSENKIKKMIGWDRIYHR